MGSTNGLRILVSGMLAGVTRQGGATWAVLQYVLGLRRLGHDVRFVEPVERSPYIQDGEDLSRSISGRYFGRVAESFGLQDDAALLLAGSRQTVGLGFDRLEDFARSADLLVNLSGLLADERLTGRIPVRLYVDLDPGFTQLWSAAEGIDMRFAEHTHFATVGLAVGSPGCPVPTCGLDWTPTLQPVVLERWPIRDAIPDAPYTTVGNWRGYGSIEHEGVFYGQKAHSFRTFIDLPERTPHPLRVALAVHPLETHDRRLLADRGWTVEDAGAATGTPGSYQRFIQDSRGELGIAKAGYVTSRSGWFSDRSACYLASGRPVAAHDTGFGGTLPTGEGLLAFTTVDELAGALDAFESDYAGHARAARDMAEAHFDSDRVLTRLLESVAAPSGAPA